MGLQGSRARGEAGAESDIDTVLILDELSASDLARLRQAVAELPERDKLCGFVSGKEELRSWERSELFQFYNDTRPIFGSLDFLLPLLDRGPRCGARAPGPAPCTTAAPTCCCTAAGRRSLEN